jgi:hypothetical protein
MVVHTCTSNVTQTCNIISLRCSLQEVAGISQLLPVQALDEPGCFISAAWLESWANSEQGPGPVDNGPLLCSHARLSPDKPLGTFKYLSSTAWEALVVRPALLCVCACVRACVVCGCGCG